MSTSSSSKTGRVSRAGLATGAAAAAVLVVVGTATAPAYAAIVPATASPAAGQELVATPIQVSSASAYLAGISNPQVTFSIPACITTYTSAASTPTATPNSGITTSVGNVIAEGARKQTDYKLAVTVPADVQTNAAANAIQKWNVCVYSSSATNAPQIAAATYSVGAPATVTGVTPSSGPSAGGNTVTITGTGLPTTIGATGIVSATIDGLPLSGLKSLSETAFTGVMPAHSAAKNQTLSVTTNVGTVNLKNAYNFQNGVSVTPNTAPSSQGIVDVSVTGSNFLTPTFANGGASTSVNGHVYLVDGKYNPKANTGNKTLGPAAECTDVLVFTNTDLICRLQLASSLAADGTFNTATTRSPTDFVTTTSSPTITSATANFTQADVGRLISDAGNTNFTAGSFIKSVTNSTTAVMNINAKTTGTTGITAAIGGNRASVAATASTNGYNLTAGAGSFTSQDIGRRVTVSGGSAAASAGTVIVSVNADGTIATLSRPVAAPADVAGAIVVGDSPVADGAYVFTVVSNGAVDANTTDPNYDQSVVSSASTFTVANY